MELEQGPPENPGIVANMQTLAGNAVGLLLNRLELAGLELVEARDALLRVLLLSACGLVAAAFALAFWSVLLVYLAWDSMGWTVLLVLAGCYTLLAGFAWRKALALACSGKLGLPDTVAELKRDREALFERRP